MHLSHILLIASLLCAFGCRSQSGSRPNVIIVLADDLGYGSVGCYGADPGLVRTPHIDRLAAGGMRFTDANTPSSVCTPTRYGLLTGRYCWRSRLKFGVSNVMDPLLIKTDRPNLARLMKSKGYATAMVGKWHLGYGTKKPVDYTGPLKPGPLELGFDYQFAVPQNNGDMTGVYVENHRVVGLRSAKLLPNMPRTHYGKPYMGLDAPQRDEARNMPVLTDKAVAWLEGVPKGKPFLLYFAATAVHKPIWPSPDVEGRTKAGAYTDFILDLDETVARLMAVVKKKGVGNRTIFLFTSDNGGVIPRPGDKRSPAISRAVEAGLKINGDWRGRKHSIFEGGFRVPFIVRWPEAVKAGSTCDTMISLVDVYATLAEVMGVSLPNRASGAEDSISFLPQLKDPDRAGSRQSMILHSATGNFAIRRSPWKYIEGKAHPRIKPSQVRAEQDELRPQLYSLIEDPAERDNRIEAKPEVAGKLIAELNSIRRQGYSRLEGDQKKNSR